VSPPSLITLGRKLAQRPVVLAKRWQIYPYGFRGAYATWNDALRAAGNGYDNPRIAARSLRSTRALEDAFQQLAGIPPPGALRLRDALLLVHGRLGTSDLKVLDFGGALGHHCLLVRRLLPADLRLRWMAGPRSDRADPRRGRRAVVVGLADDE
jgi:hypothetical protein